MFNKKSNIEPLDPTKPEEEVKEEVKQEEEIVEKPDRANYNCTSCKGEGLVYEGVNAQKCPLCSGTGKVN